MNSRTPTGLVALAALLAAGLGQQQARAQTQAPTQAQTEAQARGLSELAVVQSTVQRNPSLHVALLRATQSRYALNAEQGLYTPIFDANAGYTHSRSPSLSADGVQVGGGDAFDVGAGITKPFAFGTVLSASLAAQRATRTLASDTALMSGVGLGPNYSLLGQVALSQPLMRGVGNDVGLASLRQAKLSLGASELAAQQAASQLLGQVLSAYWELWYAGEVVRINEATRELVRAQQEEAQQQVASGALAPASALPYATQVAELEEVLLAARTQRRLSELQLAQLLGEPKGVGVGLFAADQPEPPAVDEPSEARAVSEALENSYARKQLQAQLAIVKDQLKIAGDPLRPRLDLDAYVQAQGLGSRDASLAVEQVGKLEAVSAHVGLTFELPLTDTRRQAQIQSAQLTAHITQKQIEEADLAIRSSVASALARWRAARDKLTLSSETERVANEQATAERLRFQAGSSIAISVRQAEDSWRQAQLRVQRAKVDLVLVDLELAEVRGQLLGRYAAAIQRLPAADRTTITSTHTNF